MTLSTSSDDAQHLLHTEQPLHKMLLPQQLREASASRDPAIDIHLSTPFAQEITRVLSIRLF